jgi:hypothetical protein
MKKNLLFVLMLCASTTLATVRTVNNYGGAQFTDIASAINAAVSGDTIYIHGTPTYYCQPNVAKDNLTFIGPGFNPSKQSPLKAYVACGAWTLGFNNVVIGMDIEMLGQNGTNAGSSVQGYRDLTLKRCRIYNTGQICTPYGNYSSSGNLFFENCIFNGYDAIRENCYLNSFASNIVFRNCLFYGAGLFGNMNQGLTGIVVENCVFYGSGGGIVNGSNGNAQISFSNNIFVNRNIGSTSGSILYYNNYSTTENLNINGGVGNIQGANPMFVNAPGGTFAYTHDYHLAAGSPCIGAGTAGSDMGMYSGHAPFIWEGNPPVPQIDYFNIIGTQAPQNGSINVTFQSTIKN